jgi:intracellular septation protein A
MGEYPQLLSTFVTDHKTQATYNTSLSVSIFWVSVLLCFVHICFRASKWIKKKKLILLSKHEHLYYIDNIWIKLRFLIHLFFIGLTPCVIFRFFNRLMWIVYLCASSDCLHVCQLHSPGNSVMVEDIFYFYFKFS